MGQPFVTIGGKEVFTARRPAGGTRPGETRLARPRPQKLAAGRQEGRMISRAITSLAIVAGITLAGLIGLLILRKTQRG